MEESKTLEQPGQVSKYMSRAVKELPKLHDRVDTLASKLSIVLRSETPEKSSQEETSELVSLACLVRDFGFSTRSARAKIESILDRLEL